MPNRTVGSRAAWARRARAARGPFLEGAAVAVAASALAVWLLRFWNASPRVPMAGSGDGLLIQTLLKGMHEHGWWLHNPDLNAPYGQSMHDFPFGGENLQLVALKVLTFVTGDPGLTMNVYYLASFPAVAVVAYFAFRHLRFSRSIAGAVALLFAFLPYHFARGQGHLFRAPYVSVPVAALLLLWVLSPDDLRGRRAWMLAVAAAVVIGSTETMTTAFTMTLLVATGLVAALRYREWRRLGVAAVLAGVMALTFLANQAPTLAYVATHGPNEEAGRRKVWESEQWGLKLNMMLLPHEFHRVEPLGELGAQPHQEGPVPSEGGQALGVVAALGFLAALFALVARGMGPRSPDIRDPEDRGSLMSRLGLLSLTAVLFGTVGGLSYLLSLMGFAQIRVWNRIVVLIAFFALTAVAVGLERFGEWARFRRWPAWTAPLAVLAVAAVGWLDQTDKVPVDHERNDQVHERLNAFLDELEGAVPAGLEVFQWPPVPFPENPDVFQMRDYEHLRAYLHSDTLRWSYGGVRGRDKAMWQFELNDVEVDEVPEVLVAMGYGVLWLDTYGVLDGPATSAAFLEATGSEPLVDGTRRYHVFDLRPLRELLEGELTDGEWEALRRRVLRGYDLETPEGAPGA